MHSISSTDNIKESSDLPSVLKNLYEFTEYIDKGNIIKPFVSNIQYADGGGGDDDDDDDDEE